MARLADLEVLVVDCQATAAAPRGHLLELGWARVRGTTVAPQASLIALPDGQRIPPAVARITGISERALRSAVESGVAWRALSQQARQLPLQPAPTVIHFARFEEPFLASLAGGTPPLDIVCTHQIAARLLPDLPRRSLRALTGYFGKGVGTLRRSADHVEATAFVWRELLQILEAQDIVSWSQLKAWLAGSRARATKVRRRVWPMPRDVRLSLPDAPGIYRMLRTSGDVLYVGKATSLRHRVNSYFRHQHGIHERALEMLSQARAISFEITPTPLEAALLEADEIKRHRPPYNVALTDGDRRLWFAPCGLGERSARSSARFRVGPFPSPMTLDQFAALARGCREALGTGRWAPDADVFSAGYTSLCGSHPELARRDLHAHARLLRLGTRLWREGRRDRDDEEDDAARADRRPLSWTPEYVQLSLERLALRAALACRRARWLTRLLDAAVVWNEPGQVTARLLVLDAGEITISQDVAPDVGPPIPPVHSRTPAMRRDLFTIARFDRLRVLTTELKRLSGSHTRVAVRFGTHPALDGERLAAALSWV